MSDTVRRAQQLAGKAESAVKAVAKPLRNYGFPYRSPSVPKGVVVPQEPSKLGANYDTGWARTPIAQAARAIITEGPLRLMVRGIANPDLVGLDRLADLMRLDDPPAVIFAPNHHSHVDTGLMIRAIPWCWRKDLVVAAAADYFFDTSWKAAMSALALNAIPIDREVTGRKSSDMFRDLLADGHSLLIYPEGGRSPDGWGQRFKGGAAYLSSRSGAPVVPVFIDGTGPIFGKGMKRPKPGRTKVVFGAPLWPQDDENTRRYNTRIEEAVDAARRRGAHRFLDREPPRRAGHQPVAHRARVQRLASPVGARRAPQARRRRHPPPPEASLARPGLSHGQG